MTRSADITVILTAYRRPQALAAQWDAIRCQTAVPRGIWVWANEPDAKMQGWLETLECSRVVTCGDNAGVHARFALGLLAPTPFVAVFDDDTIPGPSWLENCIDVMNVSPGILGAAGVRLQGTDYRRRTMHGWHDPQEKITEVDLVGHAWFLRREWLPHLFAADNAHAANGEDVELAARAYRLAGIRCFCPPHPPHDRALWGSMFGERMGSDAVAASRRPQHLAERDTVVREEIAAGWKPLWMRGGVPSANRNPDGEPRISPTPLTARANPSQWAAEKLFPALPLHKPDPDFAAIPHQAGERVLVVGDSARQWTDAHLKTTQREFLAIEDGRIGDLGKLKCEDYDTVVLGSTLENLRAPRETLQSLKRLTTPNTRVVGWFRNARHHSVVSSLIGGRWPAGSAGSGPPAPLRIWTIREMEKLAYRAEFDGIVTVALDEEVAAWRKSGKGAVRIPGLELRGIDPKEAEEFFASWCRYELHPHPSQSLGLTSIVIVTHNNLALTRACLESIRFVTDAPYELILVDNGSTDGSADNFRACGDVRAILNPDNRGFPAAANQGIKAARGDQVLLLNNDTLATTGWLRRMLGALHSDPHVGLVGPCSNNVSGEQQIAVDYDDLAQLDGFAWEHGKRAGGHWIDTDRLVGFCLLIRREVIDKVGLLDERFGIGNFEDDDLCLRVQEAGFRLVNARDAFVHHVGSATFRSTGTDFSGLLHANRQKFLDKWQGDERVAGLRRLESRDDVPADVDRYRVEATNDDVNRPLVSLCMIVRDNENTIRPCLESIRPWVDEMIVVDTGSRDATPKIAEELGARVERFPWVDDFARARNESLQYASGKWVFWMDSDDTIPPESGKLLRELASQTPPDGPLGYVMQVHCPGSADADSTEMTVVDHVKLFRNQPEIRFEGRIHEQVIPSIRALDGEVAWSDGYVIHSGADHTPEGKQRKLARDLHLLKLDLEERPEHTFVLFNLGMTHADAGDYAEAADWLRRSLKASTPGESHVRKIYALLVNALFQLRRYDEAWDVCREGLHIYLDDPELTFRAGMLHHQFGRNDEAVAMYRRLLQHRPAPHFKSIDVGIGGFKARHNLAVVLDEQRRFDEAEKEWKTILEEHPHYRMAWRGLGQILVKTERWKDAENLRNELQGKHSLAGESALLAAQIAKAKNDVVGCRDALKEALQTCDGDTDVEYLRAWCEFAFHHETPTTACEALASLCDRAPEDPSAWHNYGSVLARLERNHEAADALQKSIALRPDSVATWRQLAQAYRATGKNAEADIAESEAGRREATPPSHGSEPGAVPSFLAPAVAQSAVFDPVATA